MSLARAALAPVARVVLDERWIDVTLPGPHVALGWTIVGGGRRIATRRLAWHRVDDAELAVGVDPARWLRARLRARGAADAVALLTSRRLEALEDATARSGGVRARCLATVGLGNAVRVGDAPGPLHRVGTINLAVLLETALTPAAHVEALAIAVEARTTAVLDARIPSRRGPGLATGTGTDCVVVAAPATGPRARFAGTHTHLGAAIGAAVYDAVARGAAAWRQERRCPG